MDAHETYKGHAIWAETFKEGKGWRWSYQIDGGPLRECRDRPLRNEQLMLEEAIGEAKHEIDRAESAKESPL